MDSAGESITGGCQCGALRYRLMSKPPAPSVCHCRMCQKAGGAPFMVFGGVPLADFEWTRGTAKLFASSDFAKRGFCGDCGTPLTYQSRHFDRISVTIGSLDNPSSAPPVDQIGVESRLPWFAALAALPSFRTGGWMTKHGFEKIASHQHPDHET